jgi:hypothetical protein
MFSTSSHVRPLRNRVCPRCSDYALRVRRRLIDRILHPFSPVRRYQCMSTACGWVGNVKATDMNALREPASAVDSAGAAGAERQPQAESQPARRAA